MKNISSKFTTFETVVKTVERALLDLKDGFIDGLNYAKSLYTKKIPFGDTQPVPFTNIASLIYVEYRKQ